MKVAARSNLDINRDVRRIFVAHWIDLGRLSIRSAKDSVYLSGSLRKLPGVDSDVTAAQVEAMYKKIKCVGSVKHVRVEFDNWFHNHSTGAWETLANRHKQAPRAVHGFEEKRPHKSYRVEK